MQTIPLDDNGNFNVRESALINTVIGFIFLGVLGMISSGGPSIADGFHIVLVLYLLLLIGALYFFISAAKKKIIITINTTGIYNRGKLVTNWECFENAYIMQEEYRTGSRNSGMDDKFNIMILYVDPAAGMEYLYPMRMSGSQDMSEYDIISAIAYFSGVQLSMDIFGS